MQFVEDCLIACLSLGRIARLTKKQFDIGSHRTTKLIERVREDWKVQAEKERPHYKQAAINRIQSHILKAKEAKNWGAVASFEKLLADIQGTKAPIRVDVNIAIQAAVVQVVSGLTPQQMQDMLAEYDENVRLAQLTRGAQPVLPEHAA